MKIYLDLIFILNFSFDFILLTSINYILKRNIKIKKIILGSLFGSITIITLFIRFSSLIIFLIKTLTALIMLLITFGYKDFNYLKKNLIYFYLVSMIMGGGIYFLKDSLSLNYIIILILSLILYLIYIKSFKDLKINYNNYYNCHLYFDDYNYISLSAFLDTGNKLKDPYSNKSIILVAKNRLSNVKIRSPIYVPYNSLNNHGLLTCFKPSKIVIDGLENKNFLVGISEEKMFIDGIECIINLNILEGLKWKILLKKY